MLQNIIKARYYLCQSSSSTFSFSSFYRLVINNTSIDRNRYHHNHYHHHYCHTATVSRRLLSSSISAKTTTKNTSTTTTQQVVPTTTTTTNVSTKIEQNDTEEDCPFRSNEKKTFSLPSTLPKTSSSLSSVAIDEMMTNNKNDKQESIDQTKNVMSFDHQHNDDHQNHYQQQQQEKKSQPLKPYHEIPGPRSLPFIGNLWRYFPIIGNYRLTAMDKNGFYNLSKYGKIVREDITAQHRIVHLFDPRDMETMFKQEGVTPYRRSHRALLKYRRDRPHIYQSGGIFPENGAEWLRVRNLFKKQFLLAKNVNTYDVVLNEVSNDLVQYVRQTRDPNSLEVKDFQQDMYRWALESICAILLDSRIGCLGVNLPEDSDPSRLIQSGHKTIHAVMRTELYDSWEKRDTKDYRQLVEGQDEMAKIVDKYLSKRIEEVMNLNEKNDDQKQQPHANSMLTQFILDPAISRKDLLGMTIDSIMAGIDTTSISASFCFYFLARYPQYQDRLRQEIRQVVGPNGDEPIRVNHFTNMPWLRAIVKETLRLRPLSIGVGRLTTTSMNIGGYEIPPNTMLITHNLVSCQLEEYFEQASRFYPERWMVDRSCRAPGSTRDPKNRFLWLPFGHGTRMCLGRRVAELEIYILLTKLIANMRVEYDYEPIEIETRLINIPDRPMRFRFVDLTTASQNKSTEN